MSCPEHELLSAYADGELESSMLAETERHLSGCAACREFVQEMGWLESYGRASLRTISVRAGPDPITIFNTAERPRRLSPVALAAAAIVLVALSVLTWSETRRLTHLGHVPPQVPAEIPRPVDGVDRAETAEIVKGYRIRASSDEAFERWADPYRRLRIPLVPMEELANYEPREALPVLPPALRQLGTSYENNL